MLNFVFGRTFWSTVIRSAMFFPLMSAMSLPLLLAFGSVEEVTQLRSTSVTMWAVTLLWGSLFGSWVGWGVAYGRFEERPVRPGMFAIYPLATGLIHGPVFWAFISDLSKLQPDIADDRMAATIFGLVVGPPMALLTSVGWRYALHLTALRKA